MTDEFEREHREVQDGHNGPMDWDDLLLKCGSILGVEQLRADDDFFGVGGNSLDAVEICEMLSRELTQEVDLEIVLRSSTFAEMLRTLSG